MLGREVHCRLLRWGCAARSTRMPILSPPEWRRERVPRMKAMLQRRSPLLWLASAGVLTARGLLRERRRATPTPSPATPPSPTPTPHAAAARHPDGVGPRDRGGHVRPRGLPGRQPEEQRLVPRRSVGGGAFRDPPRPGEPWDRSSRSPVNLGPGETLAVSADCTDACDGATSVSVTVSVGSWPDQRRRDLRNGARHVLVRAVPPRSRIRRCHGHARHRRRDARLREARWSRSRSVATPPGRSSAVGRRSSSGRRERPCAVDVPVVINAAPALVRAGSLHGLVGRVRSRLSDLQSPVTGCGRVADGSGRQLPSRRESPGTAGVEPPQAPARGELPGARPDRSDPRCICPNGHVASFSAA